MIKIPGNEIYFLNKTAKSLINLLLKACAKFYTIDIKKK